MVRTNDFPVRYRPGAQDPNHCSGNLEASRCKLACRQAVFVLGMELSSFLDGMVCEKANIGMFFPENMVNID